MNIIISCFLTFNRLNNELIPQKNHLISCRPVVDITQVAVSSVSMMTVSLLTTVAIKQSGKPAINFMSMDFSFNHSIFFMVSL